HKYNQTDLGALNHSQYLYKTRPWEQKSILYFDIFMIEMSRLKIDLRNIEIMKVSPLMVEGYRYWLNNISRYSYNFYNLKHNKEIILKISDLNIIDLNWSKLIIFLQNFFFYSILNSKTIILKKILKLYKIHKLINKKIIFIKYFLSIIVIF